MRIFTLHACVASVHGNTLVSLQRGQIMDVPIATARALMQVGRAIIHPSEYHPMTYDIIPYLRLKNPATAEPITLSDVKSYLRVEHDNEDDFITSLITVARNACEHYMRRSIMPQSWILSFDEVVPVAVMLPRGVVQSITGVILMQSNGTSSVIHDSTYHLHAGRDKLVFDSAPTGYSVEIEYVAGYQDANDVPLDIKQAILAYIASLYDYRPDVIALPTSTRQLLNPYRVVSL